ncbi:MAG: hypothetical protein KBA61_11830 [Spirochaetes bacterium]|nr:hypothetical protein [Spirochaetota bacterium]
MARIVLLSVCLLMMCAGSSADRELKERLIGSWKMVQKPGKSEIRCLEFTSNGTVIYDDFIAALPSMENIVKASRVSDGGPARTTKKFSISEGKIIIHNASVRHAMIEMELTVLQIGANELVLGYEFPRGALNRLRYTKSDRCAPWKGMIHHPHNFMTRYPLAG